MKEVAYKSKWAEKTKVIIWSWGQGPEQVMTLVFLWGYGKHLESRLKCSSWTQIPGSQMQPLMSLRVNILIESLYLLKQAGGVLRNADPALKSVVVLYLVVWLEGAGRVGPYRPNWQIIKASVNLVKRVSNSAEKSIWFCNPNNCWIDQLFLLPATY